jgi:CheY-like chemotaxis protein
VACCCSDELAAQIEKTFGSCRRLKPNQRPPSSLDLLFLEPTEETPLTHLLDAMQLDDPMAMIICAERLSLRELHHAIDRGAVQILTETSSAPSVAQERLSALARRLQSRKRLSVALKMLIRVPLDVREAAGQIRRRRILLVEDEAVMLKVMISILKPHGYQLFGCSTGEEAINLLEKERIDLVIADKNLPDISGLDVVRASKERYPWSSALIITGYASQASAEEALQLGAVDYLIKPFDLNELVSRVQDALAMQRASRSAGTAERPRGVVLADPDPRVQQILEEVFSQNDDPIIGKGAPSDALKLLSEQQVGVVVVSVDQDLSEREREYLERARDACPQMVVLATTSSPGLGRTVEALRLGARALLRTPFSDISRLTEEVKEACGREQD